MTDKEASYERGARIVCNLVRDWTGPAPLFCFPPRSYFLIADLRDIGHKLTRNDAARELLALLIKRSVERTGHAPTAAMLRIALEMSRYPIEQTTLAELGLGAATQPQDIH